MGIALDFEHLFVAKTELQAAVDGCAPSAARELDGQSTALTRAASAGQSTGNANRVNMQSRTWGGQGKIIVADITFRDSAYALTTAPAAARAVPPALGFIATGTGHVVCAPARVATALAATLCVAGFLVVPPEKAPMAFIGWGLGVGG